MEYTYRNSSSEEMTTVILQQYALLVKRGAAADTTIPYANVTGVTLASLPHALYKTSIRSIGHKSVVITNKARSLEESFNQGRTYALFIRILHFHLKNKSCAVYSVEHPTKKVWFWGMICIAMSLTLSFIAVYLRLSLLHPIIIGGAVFIILVSVGIASLSGGFQKQYKPTEIPTQFLP